MRLWRETTKVPITLRTVVFITTAAAISSLGHRLHTSTACAWLGLRVGGHPALSLHSSNEPGELSQ